MAAQTQRRFGIYSIPAGCSGSLATVITDGPKQDGGFYWRDLTFNYNASKIFLDQFINALGGGTYVVDKVIDAVDDVNDVWGSYERKEQLPFPVSIALIDHDSSGLREVLATGTTSVNNPCGEIIVVDIDRCLADVVGGSDCASIVGPNVLGSNPSWLSDGQVAYQDRIYKRQGRNYSCKTGDISVADPFATSPNPIHLGGGWEPLGWIY